MKPASVKRLWAPWRIKYIRNPGVKKCIFCNPDKYVVFKTKHSVAMLNIYPYNNGHIMISPVRHVKDLSLLKDQEILDLFNAVKKAQRMLDKVLNPHGYNIGMNIGSAAGAGIPDHLHIHIVPRWGGDTNFMPTVAETKIVSQSLKELLKLLRNVKPETS